MGLDPAIHVFRMMQIAPESEFFARRLDGRVKPGHDELGGSS